MATISGTVNLSDLEVPGAAEVILMSSDCSSVVDTTTSDPVTGAYSFTGLPDGAAYRIMVRSQPTYRSKIFGPVYTSDSLVFDGSTYAGWTLVGSPTPAVDSPVGLPPPSLAVENGTQYAYIESTLPLDTAPATIEFDVRVTAGSGALFDFPFGCDASGAGPYLRIECRPGNVSGIGLRASWTSFSVPTGAPNQAPDTWHHVRISVKSDTLIDWYLNDVLMGEDIAVVINGSYIGLSAYATSVALSKSNIDNLVIYPGV